MVSFASSIGASSSFQTAAGPSTPLRRDTSVSDRSAPAKCPVDHQSMAKAASSQMPADHPYAPNAVGTAAGPAKCPVQHGQLSQDLNPANNIPSSVSPITRAPGQQIDLPTDRTASTIPRPLTGDAGENAEKVWDYPSPQQFYNALVRKGWETPEESVEMMVFIHNFLNERAWQEVLDWEKKYPGGERAQLARFQGRPGELSPKARMHLWAGKLFPSKFNAEPPFDRHDWLVTRVEPETKEQVETRYVIDYYSAPDDEEGNPVFHLDVRPALDNWRGVWGRVEKTWDEWKSGGQEAPQPRAQA